MRVLMVQEIPEIRNLKTARMLAEAGLSVDGAFTVASAGERLPGTPNPFGREWRIESPGELWQIMRRYDIVHAHNAPDRLPALALAGRRRPENPAVVWDCHDLVSLLKISDPRGGDAILEAFCARQSDARIFAAPAMRDICAERYGFDAAMHATTLVTLNTPARWMRPHSGIGEASTPTKFSASDGRVHVVYAGSLSNRPGDHRYFADDFRDLLARTANVVLHVLPAISPITSPTGIGGTTAKLRAETFADYHAISRAGRFQGRFHWHSPVPPQDLIATLARFDVGWLPFHAHGDHADFAAILMPNKLFEYRAAGLRIAASRLPGVLAVTNAWAHTDAQSVIIADSIADLAAHLDALAGREPLPAVVAAAFAADVPDFDAQLPALLNLYRAIA